MCLGSYFNRVGVSYKQNEQLSEPTVFMSMLFCRETWCVIGHFTQQLRLPGIFDCRLLYGWSLLGKMG